MVSETPATVTKTGRTVNPPCCLIEEMGDVAVEGYKIKLTEAKEKYYTTMDKLGEMAIATLRKCVFPFHPFWISVGFILHLFFPNIERV